MMIDRLPSREQEIARIVYARAQASATDICAALPDPLSNAAVRSMLRRLETKGVVRRRKEGKKFLYVPAEPNEAARRRALLQLSRDYFDGSLTATAETLAAMLPSPRDA